MIFANIARQAQQQLRTITTTAARQGGGGHHHDIGGIPGSNLPFSIHNRHKLALYMIMWLGSGFAVPFLLVRHQLLKK